MEPSQVPLFFAKSLGVQKFTVVQLCGAELLALGAGDFFAPDHLDKLLPRGSVYPGAQSLLLCSRSIASATTVHPSVFWSMTALQCVTGCVGYLESALVIVDHGNCVVDRCAVHTDLAGMRGF